MSCAIVSVITNKDSDANNFIRKKYSTAYLKHIEGAGLDEPPHQNVYKLSRTGELSRYKKNELFDSSCTCYICESKGVKFDSTNDSMRQWLDFSEESETALSSHALSERKLLFPFQIPQKNLDKIPPSSLVCDKCLYDISVVQHQTNEPHPRMEMDGDEADYLEGIEDAFNANDNFMVYTDYCVNCGEDYMITPEEHTDRHNRVTLGRHHCDNCLMSNGFEEEHYLQIKTCDSCQEEMPYDLSLTGYINNSYPIEECPTCCLNNDKKRSEELEHLTDSQLPFPDYVVSNKMAFKELHNDMKNGKIEKPLVYSCEEFGDYYLQLWQHTNIAFMLFEPPNLKQDNVNRLTFSIFLIDGEVVQEDINDLLEIRNENVLFSRTESKASIHHDCIEQAIFVYGEEHHHTYPTDFSGQWACHQAAHRFAEECYNKLDNDLKLFLPML